MGKHIIVYRQLTAIAEDKDSPNKEKAVRLYGKNHTSITGRSLCFVPITRKHPAFEIK